MTAKKTYSDQHSKIFDSIPELYDKSRPGYPAELIEEALAFAGLPEGGKVLEIGCGTGQLTIPLARRGYGIIALDRGANLAAFATEKFKDFSKVRIVNAKFEDWDADSEKFDLVTSAQAFHWIKPEYGIRRAAKLLRPGGSLALIWNLQERSRQTDFWKATDPIYEKYSPGESSGNYPLVKSIELLEKQLVKSLFFEDPVEIRKEWSQTYSHDEYIALLRTYSDHISLPEPQQSDFFAEISRIIGEMGGKVERLYETLAVVAKRKRD